MKKLLKLSLALVVVLTLSHCNKEDGPGGEDVVLTPEANKELLQEIGVDFVNELSAMQQTEGVQALTSIGLLVDLEDEEEGGRTLGKLFRANKAIVGLANGKVTVNQFAAMPVVLDAGNEEDKSLQEIFDENSGTYEWNAETEEFDFTDNSEDEIMVKYPTPEDGASNNTTLTFSNYNSVQVSNPIEEDYSGDLPTSLDISLELDGETVVTYSFDANYNNEGIPESVETALFVSPFTLSAELTNTNTKIGALVNLSNGDKTLIETSTEFNGDFSDAAIEAAEEDEDKIADVINNGGFTFIMLDLKLEATVAFAALYPKVSDLDTYYDEYEGNTDPMPDMEANAQVLEDALNAHVEFTSSYISTGDVAAEIEWYTFVESEDYGSGTDHSVELGARMVFEDGSKVDLEDYLGTGFTQLEGAINDLIDQIGEDIGEDLDHIDFDDLD